MTVIVVDILHLMAFSLSDQISLSDYFTAESHDQTADTALLMGLDTILSTGDLLVDLLTHAAIIVTVLGGSIASVALVVVILIEALGLFNLLTTGLSLNIMSVLTLISSIGIGVLYAFSAVITNLTLLPVIVAVVLPLQIMFSILQLFFTAGILTHMVVALAILSLHPAGVCLVAQSLGGNVSLSQLLTSNGLAVQLATELALQVAGNTGLFTGSKLSGNFHTAVAAVVQCNSTADITGAVFVSGDVDTSLICNNLLTNGAGLSMGTVTVVNNSPFMSSLVLGVTADLADHGMVLRTLNQFVSVLYQLLAQRASAGIAVLLGGVCLFLSVTAGTALHGVGFTVFDVNHIIVLHGFFDDLTAGFANTSVLKGIRFPFSLLMVAYRCCLSLDGDYADEHGSDQCEQHSHYSIVHKVFYYLLHCCLGNAESTLCMVQSA